MRQAWMLLRRAPLSAKIGLAIVALNLLAALLAPLIAPHGETAVVGKVWAGGFWAADFGEAARLRGEGLWWVMRHAILLNAAAPLVAEFGLRFCFVFLFIAALSFLGLGLQPPAADWGGMVRENAAAISWGIVTPLI